MLLRTVPAIFDENLPISFVKMDGKDFCCYFPSSSVYSADNSELNVLIYSIHVSKKTNTFAGFKVREVRNDDIPIVFLPFVKTNNGFLSQCWQKNNLKAGPTDLSPGLLKDYLIERNSSNKEVLFHGFAQRNPKNELIFRLEGIEELEVLDEEKLKNASNQPSKERFVKPRSKLKNINEIIDADDSEDNIIE